MGEGRSSIEAISIHFVSGVAIAAAVPWKGLSLYWATAACCGALAVSCAVLSGRGSRRWAAFPAFIAAGMMCWITDALCGSPAPDFLPAASRALERLCSAIDSVPFSHQGTGPLVKALLTGDRTGLDSGTVATFRSAGAAHILALSGLHLGMIYGLMGKLFSVAGNSRTASVCRSVLTVLLCAFYTLMTGAGASTVRAFLFILFREISIHQAERRHRGTDTLCTALTVHLLLRPSDVDTLGFQLSYLAMLGIFEIAPILKGFWPDDGGKGDMMRRVWESAAVTLSCQITTAPLLWLKMGAVPGHFLLTNLLALPLTEGLIVCSVVTVAASAAGLCPETLEGLTDLLAQTLLHCLGVISGM